LKFEQSWLDIACEHRTFIDDWSKGENDLKKDRSLKEFLIYNSV